MAGDRHHLAVMQAELAGEAENLFGLPGNGQDDRQRVTRHVVGDWEIRVVDMIAEFPDVGEKACAIFCQRAGGTCADKYNTFRCENNIDGAFE